MILGSQARPFSRQSKSSPAWPPPGHQTASNTGPNCNQKHQRQHQADSLCASAGRKPAPRQPAPERPQNGHPSGAAFGHNANGYRSLNRLDMARRRQQQVQPTRNLSSLGHHPSSSSPLANTQQIYAPASIASPRELANYRASASRQPAALANGQASESHHYAASSFRGPASESGRSCRPDSALGHLLDKFDTLRRRARWSRSSRSKTSAASSLHDASKFSTPSNGVYSVPRQQIGCQFVAESAAAKPSLISDETIVYDSTKKHLEADEIYAEGLRAIDGNAQRRLLEHQLDAKLMLEGETKVIIDEQSRDRADFKQLTVNLINWINDELAEQRIIVRDLQEDLFDGQVLCKLIEKLQQIKLDIVEVTQNEQTQKFKLKTVLDTINRILVLQARWAKIRWSVDGIHGKNFVEIIHLLVALAIFYRAPLKLPPNIQVMVHVVQKKHDKLIRRTHHVQLTDSLVSKLDQGMPKQQSSLKFPYSNNLQHNNHNHLHNQQQQQRDAFDTLFEFAPEKLDIVQQALIRFVNRHLNKINMSCNLYAATTTTNPSLPTQHQFQHQSILDPEQFSDGLLLVFLISSLEDYFVPLGNLFTATTSNRPTSLITLDAAYDDKLPFIDANNNNCTANLEDTYASCQPLQTALEPTSFINTQPIEKLHNINVAFQLMDEAGIDVRARVRAEDIANGDLKAVLRVLYALFSRYKHI